jgi:hypothetical protein
MRYASTIDFILMGIACWWSRGCERIDPVPQRVKPVLIRHGLRGPEGPLFHGGSGFSDGAKIHGATKAKRAPLGRPLLNPCHNFA